MRGNRARNTRPERDLRRALRIAGLSGYRVNWRVPGHPDISYPGRRVAVFVHGCFWHACPKCQLPIPKTNTEFWELKFQLNRERDLRKSVHLAQLGWRVLEIWECDIRHDVDGAVESVRLAILASTAEHRADGSPRTSIST